MISAKWHNFTQSHFRCRKNVFIDSVNALMEIIRHRVNAGKSGVQWHYS